MLGFAAMHSNVVDAADICPASNAAEFGNCVKSVNGGKYDGIEVTAPIACDDSTNLCQFTVTNIHRSLVVQGRADYEIGFHRSGEHGGYKHNTLTIQNSTGPILVRNLVFDEGKNQPLAYEMAAAHDPAVSIWTNQISSTCTAQEPPPGKTYLNPCPGNSLRIAASSNVTVDKVRFLEAKNFGIAVDSGSGTVNIRHSLFVDSFFNAIWSQNDGRIHGLHIENDTFKDIRSNALEISAVEPDASDAVRYNTVSGNKIENSHNTGLFYNNPGCKGVGGVCGGGQVLILSKSEHFLVEGNDIGNGGGPLTNIYKQNDDVRGIEIDNVGSKDLAIRNNYIHDNSGPAVDVAFNSKMNPLAYSIYVYQNRFVRDDAMHDGSAFNNEWFLNSGQNAKNNGVLPKGACEYVPAPQGSRCNVVPARKPYDWGNSR